MLPDHLNTIIFFYFPRFLSTTILHLQNTVYETCDEHEQLEEIEINFFPKLSDSSGIRIARTNALIEPSISPPLSPDRFSYYYRYCLQRQTAWCTATTS